MITEEIRIHMFQCLQTLGQVFQVDLRVKDMHLLFAQVMGTKYVKPKMNESTITRKEL